MSFLNGLKSFAKGAMDIAYSMTFRGNADSLLKRFENKEITREQFLNLLSEDYENRVKAWSNAAVAINNSGSTTSSYSSSRR